MSEFLEAERGWRVATKDFFELFRSGLLAAGAFVDPRRRAKWLFPTAILRDGFEKYLAAFNHLSTSFSFAMWRYLSKSLMTGRRDLR